MYSENIKQKTHTRTHPIKLLHRNFLDTHFDIHMLEKLMSTKT